MSLKAPLQALLIAPVNNMQELAQRGEKTLSIREGHRDYKVGKPLALCCPLTSWCVLATVIGVAHTTLKEVTLASLAADGFRDHAEALSTLQEFYPNLNMDSEVTVLKWELA